MSSTRGSRAEEVEGVLITGLSIADGSPVLMSPVRQGLYHGGLLRAGAG